MLASYITPINIAKALKGAEFQARCIAKWSTLLSKAQEPITNGTFEFINKDLNEKEYAAPLYDQVLDWLLEKGIYLYPYLVDGTMIRLNTTTNSYWSCNILSANTHKIIWPRMLLSVRLNPNKYAHPTKYKAYDQAIMQALKILASQPIIENGKEK